MNHFLHGVLVTMMEVEGVERTLSQGLIKARWLRRLDVTNDTVDHDTNDGDFHE